MPILQFGALMAKNAPYCAREEKGVVKSVVDPAGQFLKIRMQDENILIFKKVYARFIALKNPSQLRLTKF
jgi:hypothetical protein